MKSYWNQHSNTMHIHDTDAKGFPFILSIKMAADGKTTEHVGFTRPEFVCPDGAKIGSVSTGFRVLCWGDIYHRLTRGEEIPKNWFSHNEA